MFLPLVSLKPIPRKIDQRFRINEQIRSKEVRLVSDEAQEVLPLADAIARAKEQELDLIEVSPNAVPPVCKILDRGSYLYQLKKKEKRARAGSKQTEVKMVRFGFRTDQHDLDRLANQARGFMAEHHLVKVTMRLRGRELTNQEYARDKMKKFVDGLADTADVESPMRRQGNQYMVIMKAKKQ